MNNADARRTPERGELEKLVDDLEEEHVERPDRDESPPAGAEDTVDDDTGDDDTAVEPPD